MNEEAISYIMQKMSTTAIDRGMPIEQVQKLPGHEKIDTTLHYAMVKQSTWHYIPAAKHWMLLKGLPTWD